MSLQFTWRASDSALAAPLILDLARLLELCARAGRTGIQSGLAVFFKSPEEVAEAAFAEQWRAFLDLAGALPVRARDFSEPAR